MKRTISININTDEISTYTDEYVAQLWHVAQTNPAEFGDKDAGELVAAIGHEIIRRWLKATPVSLYHHQERSHFCEILRQHGKWIDGVWMPNGRAQALEAVNDAGGDTGLLMEHLGWTMCADAQDEKLAVLEAERQLVVPDCTVSVTKSRGGGFIVWKKLKG